MIPTTGEIARLWNDSVKAGLKGFGADTKALKPMAGKSRIVKALTLLQTEAYSRTIRTRGLHVCKICDGAQVVGRGRYYCAKSNSGLTWPDYLMHYIKVHNIVLPEGFARQIKKADPNVAKKPKVKKPKASPESAARITAINNLRLAYRHSNNSPKLNYIKLSIDDAKQLVEIFGGLEVDQNAF